MALKAGRRGLKKFMVDAFGNMKNSTPTPTPTPSISSIQNINTDDITVQSNVIVKNGNVVTVCFIGEVKRTINSIGIIPSDFLPNEAFATANVLLTCNAYSFTLNEDSFCTANVDIERQGLIGLGTSITAPSSIAVYGTYICR